MRRFLYAYLIGLATCTASALISLPNDHYSYGRPINPLSIGLGLISRLVSGTLGLGWSPDESGGLLSHLPLVFAVLFLALLFVWAEALRTRKDWARWFGYALWALLAFASLYWLRPPPFG